jgi:hypothetical protein
VAGAYSVRPKPDARVSAPLTWDEIDVSDPADFTLRTMPVRFVSVGDRLAGIDDRPCSLARVLELSATQAGEGLGDAPWPPHYRKQSGEPARVQPSRARSRKAPPAPVAPAARNPAAKPAPTGRRASTKPLLEIGRARSKDDALAGLERWKARHPEAAAHLDPADVLVDAMRGRFQTWTRIRVNLQHVPDDRRPAQEPLDPNEDPLTEDWQKAMAGRRRRPSTARTES